MVTIIEETLWLPACKKARRTFFSFLSYFYPYPSSFSFWGSHLLPRQDLDDISIPFQIYFIQATTTRFLDCYNSPVFGVEA